MAYTLCLLNSSQPPHLTSFSCSPSICRRPRRLTFGFNFNLTCRQLENIICCTQISLQDDLPENPDNFTSRSWKTNIWINPQTPNSPQLPHRSYDSRYDILLRLSNLLDSCDPTLQRVSEILSSIDALTDQDAVNILNSMSNPTIARIALEFFLQHLKPAWVTVFYNVTMKVLRKSMDLGLVEKLFDEMIERGAPPDNATFSTIISTARSCSLPDKALEWYEKMSSFHCSPDGIIYSIIIDAYGRAGNISMVISLYGRARSEELEIDSMVITLLIRSHGMSGNIGKCLQLYEGMKALGVTPSLLMCNNLLIALGRGKMPWHAKTVQKDMIRYGVELDKDTYAALIRVYARARYDKDMAGVYKEMKERGVKLDLSLYNTILSVFADLGFVDEAIEVFEDMDKSSGMKPDKWTISAMITAYSYRGNVSGAEAMFYRMQEGGIVADLFVLTSLIQCYGKAKCVDKVVKTFQRVLDMGEPLDEEFFCCVLHVMSQAPKGELHKIVACIGKCHAELTEVVKLLVEEQTPVSVVKMEVCKFLDCISDRMKRAYCNCFIDLFVNLELSTKATEILDLGTKLGIYRNLISKTPSQWSLHIKSFSGSAGIVALDLWVSSLFESLEKGEEFPSMLGICTAHGNVSRSVLASAIKSRLDQLDAPFSEKPEKVGWFMTTGTAAMSWLKARRSPEMVPKQ